MENLPVSVLDQICTPTDDILRRVDTQLREALHKLERKIVVLDDDPTGVQTVHGVSVYTSWDKESLRSGFAEQNSLFFILTNSRGFSSEETRKAHKEIAQNICEISKEMNKDFVLISRSDSTLRGHFPLETDVLRETVENLSNKRYDGEILFPFFKEGGRFTIGNVHYVREGDDLVPAAQTEFAKDKSFGYTKSHMGEYVEEKTGDAYKKNDCVYISLDDLRAVNTEKITRQLMSVKDFSKVIVNAVDYFDVKVFVVSYIQATLSGREFMFRSAAALTKVLGGVQDKPLLTRGELIDPKNHYGGIVLIGSHVHKTTQQFEALRNSDCRLEFVEFNQHRVLEDGGLADEVEKVIKKTEECINNGMNSIVYTRRERFDLDTDDKDAQLRISVEISDAVTGIIRKLSVRPSFIVAKGGITSSDVGTKALLVKKATVMGQIKPGIPVWMTGPESKFPEMPYVIFPGNVGGVETLREIVDLLSAK